jgi:hypothetical protein
LYLVALGWGPHPIASIQELKGTAAAERAVSHGSEPALVIGDLEFFDPVIAKPS